MRINGEKNDGPQFVKQFKVPGYPTLVFVNAHGQEVDRIIGYRPAPEFLKELERISNNRGTIDYYTTLLTKEKGNDSLMVRLAEKWEERGDDLTAYKYWKMVLDKGEAYDELALYKIAKHQARMKKSLAPLQKFIRDYASSEYRTEAIRDLIRYYRVNKDTLSEARTYRDLIQYLATKGELTASDLNGFAWRMTQLEKYLEEALAQAKQAVAMVTDEEAQTRAQIMDTEAEVLWKLGRNVEAIEIMEQCIELQPDDDYYKQQKKKFEGS